MLDAGRDKDLLFRYLAGIRSGRPFKLRDKGIGVVVTVGHDEGVAAVVLLFQVKRDYIIVIVVDRDSVVFDAVVPLRLQGQSDGLTGGRAGRFRHQRAPVREGTAVESIRCLRKDGLLALRGAVVGHGDLVGHAADGNLHPFFGAEGPEGGDHPRPILLRGGEQRIVAHLNGFHISGKPHRRQEIGQGDRGVAFQHILFLFIREFNRIVGEALRLHRNDSLRIVCAKLVWYGDLFGREYIQRLCGELSCLLVRRDMVDRSLQIWVRRFDKSEEDLDRRGVCGFQFRSAVFVQHFDFKRVRRRHTPAFFAQLLHGGLHIRLLLGRNLADGKRRPVRERSLCRTDCDLRGVKARRIFERNDFLGVGIALLIRRSLRLRDFFQLVYILCFRVMIRVFF